MRNVAEGIAVNRFLIILACFEVLVVTLTSIALMFLMRGKCNFCIMFIPKI